jgi:hypothetical protein
VEDPKLFMGRMRLEERLAIGTQHRQRSAAHPIVTCGEQRGTDAAAPKHDVQRGLLGKEKRGADARQNLP